MDDFATGYMAGQDSGGNAGGMGGFWGDGLWAIIILAMLGFGRGGFGGGFGGGGFEGGAPWATQADVRAAVDQQTLISKLDQQTYGLADSTYALNNTITNGFHGVDNAICNLGFNMQQGFNTLGFQMKDCCCETQRLIERGFCDTNNAMHLNTRDIIDNQNANYRGLMDFLVQSKIDKLQNENADLRLKASQAAQNQYLVDQLRPCPVPAFITCNPYSSLYGGYNGNYGNNGGCGCGCG